MSFVLLGKSVLSCAFATLTLCGLTVTGLGHDFTPHQELLAVSGGGILGVVLALVARG